MNIGDDVNIPEVMKTVTKFIKNGKLVPKVGHLAGVGQKFAVEIGVWSIFISRSYSGSYFFEVRDKDNDILFDSVFRQDADKQSYELAEEMFLAARNAAFSTAKQIENILQELSDLE